MEYPHIPFKTEDASPEDEDEIIAEYPDYEEVEYEADRGLSLHGYDELDDD